VFYERDESQGSLPIPFEETESNWGGELTAFRKLQVSEWRFTAGRAFIPTGDNGKSVSDFFRVQYDRMLSERLSFKGVARYDSRSGLTDIGGGQDRDYARADLSLRWFATRTWYVGGGYSYIWEDRASATGDAQNNKIYVNFGYQGLNRQGQSAVGAR
jgi:hypothetical protein